MPASEIWTVLTWGALSSVGLLLGAIVGSFSRMPHNAIAMVMSVGAGLLLAGVSLKMTADAVRVIGPVAAALSLLLGAAIFSASNAVLARFGAADRKRCGDCIQQPAESQQPGSGFAIAFGNAFDAVGRPKLRLHLSGVECDRRWGRARDGGRICWVWFTRSDLVPATAGLRSRSAAGDDCRNDDSRSLPQ